MAVKRLSISCGSDHKIERPNAFRTSIPLAEFMNRLWHILVTYQVMICDVTLLLKESGASSFRVKGTLSSPFTYCHFERVLRHFGGMIVC